MVLHEKIEHPLFKTHKKNNRNEYAGRYAMLLLMPEAVAPFWSNK